MIPPLHQLEYHSDTDVILIDGTPFDRKMFHSIKADRMYVFELVDNKIVLTDAGPWRPVLVKGKTV